MKLILASASPRRRELFDLLKLDYMVIPSKADENIPECEPGEYVMALAKQCLFFIWIMFIYSINFIPNFFRHFSHSYPSIRCNSIRILFIYFS